MPDVPHGVATTSATSHDLAGDATRCPVVDLLAANIPDRGRTYPLTGVGCIERVDTDLATFAVGPAGVRVLELHGCAASRRPSSSAGWRPSISMSRRPSADASWAAVSCPSRRRPTRSSPSPTT